MSWIEDRITDYYKWVRERVKVRTDETTPPRKTGSQIPIRRQTQSQFRQNL